MSRRAAWAATITGAALALAPGVASAATASVTSNEGAQLPLTAPQVTASLAPVVTVAPGAGETSYKLTVFDPAGTPIAGTGFCRTSSGRLTQEIRYRGNGAYRVELTSFTDKFGTCTAGATTTTSAFTISAGTAINPLPARFLMRATGDFKSSDLPVKLAGLNTGVGRVEMHFAKDGIIGADGNLSGAFSDVFIPTSIEPRGQGNVRFSTPGTYVFVARQVAGDSATPWSAPATVRVQAPFDFQSFRFTDSRGPSYRVTVRLREKSARGKVTIALARGKKKGKYRTVGSARLSRTGTLVKRFTQRRPGTYRMRFTFKGSSTTAGGKAVQGVRFTRRVVFR